MKEIFESTYGGKTALASCRIYDKEDTVVAHITAVAKYGGRLSVMKAGWLDNSARRSLAEARVPMHWASGTLPDEWVELTVEISSEFDCSLRPAPFLALATELLGQVRKQKSERHLRMNYPVALTVRGSTVQLDVFYRIYDDFMCAIAGWDCFCVNTDIEGE